MKLTGLCVLVMQLLLLVAWPASAAPCYNTVQYGRKFQCSQFQACALDHKWVKSQAECYQACYNRYECKCAMYRPRDGKCMLKTKTCDSPWLNNQPGGEWTALTMCFHCHKTPKWWVQSGYQARYGNFNFHDDANQYQYWSSPGNANCKCSDQTGWICTFECGDLSNPASLAATGQNCSGRSCRSPNDLCMYVADAGQPPEWRCMPQNPVRNKICRTYVNGRWDGDVTLQTWSCAWYPGRKVCEGRVAKW